MLLSFSAVDSLPALLSKLPQELKRVQATNHIVACVLIINLLIQFPLSVQLSLFAPIRNTGCQITIQSCTGLKEAQSLGKALAHTDLGGLFIRQIGGVGHLEL